MTNIASQLRKSTDIGNRFKELKKTFNLRSVSWSFWRKKHRNRWGNLSEKSFALKKMYWRALHGFWKVRLDYES